MKSSTYILFFKKAMILMTVIILLDRGLGYICSKFYFTEPQGESAVTTYAIEKAKESILIFGSSRASHHYDSKYLAEVSGTSVFNCGKDGIGIRYSNIVLTEILNRYQPKLIILDVNPNELFWKGGKEGDDILISALLPYISTHDSLKKALSRIDRKEVMKADLSMLYRFNSMPVSILQHHMHIGKKAENGYLPLHGSNISDSRPEFNKDSIVKSNLVLKNDFEEFIRKTKQRNIRLVVCISPIYGNKNLESTQQEIEGLLKTHQIEFLDFSKSPEIMHSEFFYDQVHLNIQGVRIYDSMLAAKLGYRSSSVNQ